MTLTREGKYLYVTILLFLNPLIYYFFESLTNDFITTVLIIAVIAWIQISLIETRFKNESKT